MAKFNIKKNDTVIVLTGEDKGKTGKVLKVMADKQRALVEGVNMVNKSAKPSAKNPQGGFVKMEAPIHISNISLIDPKSGKATRVAKNPQGGFVKMEAPIHISNISLIDPKSGKATRVAIKREGKNVVRIAKKSGEEIK